MPPTPYFDHLDMLSTPIFVLEIDKTGVPVYAAFNACARETAKRPASDFIGKTAKEVYPGAYGRTAFARHCEVAASGKPMTYELDLPLNGRLRTVRTTLSPEIDNDGRVLRLFGSSQDITAERSALEAKVEFETLSSEMEQFVALAAHDLRSPMRNISALADMMRADFEDPADERLETLDLIERVASQSLDLITEVLAHAQSTNVEAHETAFSFPALCHCVFGTLDPKGLHSVDTSLLTLHADRTAMQIALRNLAENAIKHGGRDHLEITVDVQHGLPGMVEVTLTDNGKGFSDAAMEIMNGGRFRVDSGYGLFAIKRLITARAGTLVARNLPHGAGAVVRFSLPGRIVGVTESLGDAPGTHGVIPRPNGRAGPQRYTA